MKLTIRSTYDIGSTLWMLSKRKIHPQKQNRTALVTIMTTQLKQCKRPPTTKMTEHQNGSGQSFGAACVSELQ